jgi:hypothetical protein
VSRLRTTIGPGLLRTTSTGYSLGGDVDATQFCQAVANAGKTTDKLGALQEALTLWEAEDTWLPVLAARQSLLSGDGVSRP